MSATKYPRRFLPRYSLRALLLVVTLVAIGSAIFGYRHRQTMLAIHAHQAIAAKGVDAHFPGKSLDHSIIFKNGNVTDGDLDSFVAAFNGYAPSGLGKITALELKGSQVSAAAIERFTMAVPSCEIRR